MKPYKNNTSDPEHYIICSSHFSLPSFLQEFLSLLSPLLVDGVEMKEDEADEDEDDGRDSHQQLQSEPHGPWLITPVLVIAYSSCVGGAEGRTLTSKGKCRTLLRVPPSPYILLYQ